MPTPRGGRAQARQSQKNAAQVAEEQLTCYRLRLAGATLDQIAKQTGLSKGTVHTRISKEIAERVEPLAEEVRKMQLDRLDEWLMQLNKQVREGRQVARSIEVALRVEERRAKLMGVDAPERVDVSATVHEVTQADVELAEMLREAQAANAVDEAALSPDGP